MDEKIEKKFMASLLGVFHRLITEEFLNSDSESNTQDFYQTKIFENSNFMENEKKENEKMRFFE